MKIYAVNAFREFRHRKWRILISTAGYAIAISIVVSLLVWMELARVSTDRVLEDVGAHFIGYILPGGPSGEPIAKYPTEGFVSAGVHSSLFPAALVEEINSLPSVLDASPYLSFRIRSAKDNHVFTIGGFDPLSSVSVGSTTCAPADIVAGRYLGPDDRGKVLVERDYALARELDVGDTIVIGKNELVVIGAVTPAVRPARADIYMHIEDARQVISDRVHPGSFPPDSVNMVLVEATGSRTLDAAMTGMGAVHPGFRAFGFACWRPAARAMGMGENAVGFLIGVLLIGLFLFAGKTQLASVVEREHDIGILRVLGWSKKNIVMQIATESVMFSTAGSLIGFIIAGMAVYLVPVQAVTDFPLARGVVISPFLLFWILLLAIIGGMLAGAIPAAAAARRTPAESLRRL